MHNSRLFCSEPVIQMKCAKTVRKPLPLPIFAGFAKSFFLFLIIRPPGHSSRLIALLMFYYYDLCTTCTHIISLVSYILESVCCSPPQFMERGAQPQLFEPILTCMLACCNLFRRQCSDPGSYCPVS